MNSDLQNCVNYNPRDVFIVGFARTPTGSLNGSLVNLTAPKLGSLAIQAALKKANIAPDQVDEVYMGNVLSANIGQAPARQAAIGASMSVSTTCTTVNKVCASGMKACMLGAQSIMLSQSDIVVAGGMESMSNVPYYLPKARQGYRMGHQNVTDGLIQDGLWDVYNNFHMGNAAELCADKYKISRQEQDEYAMRSFTLAKEATENGIFQSEIVPIDINGSTIQQDESISKADFSKFPKLKSAFKKDGTVTAANASTINDGASAIVLVSGNKVLELGLKPIARIISFADAEQAPEQFTTTPALAIPKALKRANLTIDDISLFEINEAFSVVALANIQLLKLDPNKVNVFGGAVALGHPLGSSGSRIICTLITALNHKGGRYGVAAICNGGGGASAICIEML